MEDAKTFGKCCTENKMTKPKMFSLETELIKLQYLVFFSLNEQTLSIYHLYFPYYLEGGSLIITNGTCFQMVAFHFISHFILIHFFKYLKRSLEVIYFSFIFVQ